MNHIVKEIANTLAQRQPLQAIASTAIWDEPLDRQIEQLELDQTADSEQRKYYGLAIKSALHLWNDSLTKSHDISQDILNETGSYWHGIMHRLEPDYLNAKSWFDQVGSHPAYEMVQLKVSQYLQEEAPVGTLKQGELKSALERVQDQAQWDPYLFIDIAQMLAKAESAAADRAKPIVERIQWIEFVELLRFTYHQYCGGTILESI